MMIHTVRLNLSGVVEEDFESIRRLRTDAEVRQYLGGPVAEDKISSAFSAMLKSEAKVFRWAVREKTDGSFLGLVGLGRHHDGVDTEVSYELLPEWWGNGYATEAVRAVIDHALCELGLPRVVAETQTANIPSRRLLERLGMSLERTVERFGAEQSIYTTT